MTLLKELDQIHNKMHSLIGRTGESAARVVIPITLAILHQYEKRLESSSSQLEAVRLAVYDIREGGKGVLESILTDFRSAHGVISNTLDSTLRGVFREVLSDQLPPARLNSLLDYIASRKALLECFTDEDFLGSMFERLVSDAFRGDDGKFFTPKNVILIVREIMLRLLASQDNHEQSNYTVCDPCCGSARFLIYWMQPILTALENSETGKTAQERTISVRDKLRHIAEKQFFAADIDPQISSYACLNMLLHGDGANNVSTADSLNHYGIFAHWPKLVAFSKEFLEQWSILRQKYAGSAMFRDAFQYIDEHKHLLVEIASLQTTDIDIALPKWEHLFRILKTLFEVEERAASGWTTLRPLQRASDFRSISELMKYDWTDRNNTIKNGFDLVLTNPPFGRGEKSLKINAEHENERFILAQYQLATTLPIWDATIAQLEALIKRHQLDVPLKEGENRAKKARNKSDIIEDILNKIDGRELLNIDDIYGPAGSGYSTKITLRDSALDTEHTIYFDTDGLPILFQQLMPKQILFVEQFLRMVKKGGRVFTVLDTGVLSNIDDEYVRKFIFTHSEIKAIVEFPHGAFKAAKADVKTAVVLLERAANPSLQYDIFAALPNYLGFNNRKKDTPAIYQNDLGKVVCDYAAYIGEGRLCNDDCPWEHDRYCRFGDDIGMTRSTNISDRMLLNPDEANPERI